MPEVWEPQYDEEDEYYDDDELELGDEEPARPERQPQPAPRQPEFDIKPIENPNEYEFNARTKEDAARMFMNDGEIVDSLNDTVHIAHWLDNGEDRYCLFVFFPGQGGGPLLMQTADGFGLQIFKDIDDVRRVARGIGIGDIRNNANDVDAGEMPECLKENFFYYDDGSWYYDL